MKVLVVGSGGREHALAWRLKFSPQVSDLWVVGGNSGTAQIATNIPVSPEDVEGVCTVAKELAVDLVVVGPEQPLSDGLADRLTAIGIPTFGPNRDAAQLEASKSFARRILQEAEVPGPDYRVFQNQTAALDFLYTHEGRVVVKADGLAAGKGVALCANTEEAVIAIKGCMDDRIFGSAGDTVVVEEWLEGTEVSVFAFSDGQHLSTPVAACDYKQVGDGDQGPNTGGMGSFAPPAFWNSDLAEQILQDILMPTVATMADKGCPYKGMLYAGLMFTREGPKVLELNCRFGDPETQVILPQLESDPVEAMIACVEGTLDRSPVSWSSLAHVGVVMVSGGYPGAYETGKEITGLDHRTDTCGPTSFDTVTLVFHAGANQVKDDPGVARVVTSGGRVLTVVGRGESIEQARSLAYRRVEQIHFEGANYRRDIGDLSEGNRREL